MARKSLRNPHSDQEYPYVENLSIIFGLTDQYQLTREEHYILYSFYVEYSMYDEISWKKRTWIDYGWPNDRTTKNGAKAVLSKILPFDNDHFVFTKEDDLDTQFAMTDLGDGTISDIDTERGVFAVGSENLLDSYYIVFFSRIRHCLAHGEFALRLNSKNEKMVIMQNHNNENVKSRCVIKLDTLLSLARAVDIAGLL